MNLVKASESVWFNRDNIIKVEYFPAEPLDQKKADQLENGPDFNAFAADDDGPAPARLLVTFTGGTTELVTGEDVIQLKQRLGI